MIRKTLAGVGAAALLASLAGCSGVEPTQGSGDDTVTFFVTPGYDDTVALMGLWTVLLDEQGITLESQNLDLAPGFSGIARGDIDGYLNTWLPTTHQQFIEPNKDDLVIFDDGEPIFDNNALVLAVPETAPDDTIEDALANIDEYGGEIIGIEAGSGLMDTLPGVLEAYGHADAQVTAGSTPAMLASLQQAVDSGDNVLVTLWTPHWAFSEMPIKVLEDTEQAWPEPDGSYLVTSTQFAEEHPEIAEWISGSRLDDDQYAALMLEVSKADSPEEGAQNWLNDPDNRALADSWFE